MRNKLLGTFITVVLVTFCIAGCQNETVTNEVEKIVYRDRTVDITVPVIPPVNPGAKITSLQAAISLAKPGDVIDLDDELYSGITTIEPSIAVTKAVTIKNFSDLGGASLKVVSDGVVLSNIGKASVTTNSSLKISGSSLSSLSIASIDDLGRGEFVKPRPPRVELLSSDVSSDVVIALDNAALTIHDVSADNVKFNADNTQLTVEDSTSVIGRFETDKDCKVVLEDGTSDTIPCVLEKMDIGAHGKLTQVNMQAAESLILTKLSPESGLITTMKEDESIDFSQLEVIGTYMATGAVTVFTAKLTYDLQSTFTKLEKDFSVKIDKTTTEQIGNGTASDYEIAYQLQDGEAVQTNFNWSLLSAGYHHAIIESPFTDTAYGYDYKFDIAVVDKNVNYQLISLEVDTSRLTKTEYLSGEKLDLTGLIVKGTYHAETSMTFAPDREEVLLDTQYTVTPAHNTVLTTTVEQTRTVTITENETGMTATFDITVSPAYEVRFYYGTGSSVIVRVKKGGAVSSRVPPTRHGYTFVGWCSDKTRQTPVTFPLTVNSDKNLYAKWTKNKPAAGSIVYQDTTTADRTNDRYIFVENAITGQTPIGVVFDVSPDGGKMADTVTAKKIWCDVVIKYEFKKDQNGYSENDGYGTLKYGGVTNFWRNSKYYSDLNNLPTSNSDGSNNWDCIGQFVRQYNPNSNNSYYNIHTDGNFEQDDSTITTNDFNAAYYPAYQYVFSRTSDDSNNPWYIPAEGERTTLHDSDMRTTINTALGKIGGALIPSEVHWSSSLSDWIEVGDTLGVSIMRKNQFGEYMREYYNIGSRLVGDTPLYEIDTNPDDPNNRSFELQYVDIDNIAVPIERYVRAIRKFKYQSSTTGDNRYTYQ